MKDIDRRDRPAVYGIDDRQNNVRGVLLGRKGRSAYARVLLPNGVVRTFHARYVFTDWRYEDEL